MPAVEFAEASKASKAGLYNSTKSTSKVRELPRP